MKFVSACFSGRVVI